MTAGEGGGTTSNLMYYERTQCYSHCGRASVTNRYRHHAIGSNYRTTELLTTLLEAQLERLQR